MADFEAINGVAAGSIEAVNGTAKSSMEAISGLTTPSSGVTRQAEISHWWKLNETSGTTGTDSSGDNDMTLYNGASFVSDGSVPHSYAVRTDGTNDYAFATADSTTFNDTDMSYSMWLKFNGTMSFYRFVFAQSPGSIYGNGDAGVAMYYMNSDNKLYFYHNGYHGATSVHQRWVSRDVSSDMGGDGAGATQNWVHVACVIDVTGGASHLYVNGSESGNSTSSTQTPIAQGITFEGTQKFVLGADAAWHTSNTNNVYIARYANFNIKDFRIYSGVALTSANVSAIYNSGSGDYP